MLHCVIVIMMLFIHRLEKKSISILGNCTYNTPHFIRIICNTYTVRIIMFSDLSSWKHCHKVIKVYGFQPNIDILLPLGASSRTLSANFSSIFVSLFFSSVFSCWRNITNGGWYLMFLIVWLLQCNVFCVLRSWKCGIWKNYILMFCFYAF